MDKNEAYYQAEIKELKLQMGLMTLSRDHAKGMLESCETALAERDETSYEFMRTIEIMINPHGMEVPYQGDFILHLKGYINEAEQSAKMVQMLEVQKDSVMELIERLREPNRAAWDSAADLLHAIFEGKDND